jgi:hypothetical protein
VETSGQTGERLAAIDAARTLAVVGMLATHVMLEATRRWPQLMWPAGYAAGGFAVLAGVSFGFTLTPDRTRLSMWSSQLIRSALLFSLGVWLTSLRPGPIVILCVFAVLFVLALPFRRVPGRAMLVIGFIAMVALPIVSYHVRFRVPEQWIVVRAVNWEQITGANPVGNVLITLFFNGAYPLINWFPLALVGWGAARIGLLRPDAWRTMWVVATVLVLMGFGGAKLIEEVAHVREDRITRIYDEVLEFNLDGDVNNWTPPPFTRKIVVQAVDNGPGSPILSDTASLFMAGHHNGTTLEMLQILGVTAAAIAALTTLGRKFPRALMVLAWPGRISLTVYVGHLVMMWFLLRHLKVGLKLPAVQDFGVFMAYVAGVFADGFLFRRRRGPLETILRTVTKVIGPGRITA